MWTHTISGAENTEGGGGSASVAGPMTNSVETWSNPKLGNGDDSLSLGKISARCCIEVVGQML